MDSVSTIIDIQKTHSSKINDVDFENLIFGRVFTDHMFICDYNDGKWQTPKVMPYQPITLEPSAGVFHYGQAVFEGMKAYKDNESQIWLFRPEENHSRINKSAKRLAIPEFPKDYFFKGLETLLRLDANWIKPGLGNSLYIRPFVISTQPSVSASPSDSYRFFIICSPVSAYYSGDVRVLFAQQFSRSANGGTGYAKAAGNYAAQFYPTELAKQKGYNQIVWTDANTHEYLEEAGTMNIFFRIGDQLITTPTNDRILDGITRKSIIKLAEDNGIEVDVRPVTVREIIDAANNGTLKEVFGTGTATVVNPIIGFSYDNIEYDLPKLEQPYASQFKDKLIAIQYNQADDPYGWRYKVG